MVRARRVTADEDQTTIDPIIERRQKLAAPCARAQHTRGATHRRQPADPIEKHHRHKDRDDTREDANAEACPQLWFFPQPANQRGADDDCGHHNR